MFAPMIVPMMAATAALNASSTAMMVTTMARRPRRMAPTRIKNEASVGYSATELTNAEVEAFMQDSQKLDPQGMTSDEFKRRRYMEKHYGVREFDSSLWTGK